MKVIIDTCIWSAVFRKKPDVKTQLHINELLKSSQVMMIGPIRQELLSGIKNKNSFLALRDALQAFEDAPVQTKDYELAAEYFNICRSKGIQGSNTDFLICALSNNTKATIYTKDKDFLNFKKVLRINLYAS